MEMDVAIERWPMHTPFRISGMEFTDAEMLVVRLRDGDFIGRGEACGAYYRGDGPDRMRDMAESARAAIESGPINHWSPEDP